MRIALLCAMVTCVRAARPCDTAPLQGTTACDVNAAITDRADYIVSQLQLDEKLVLFANTAGGVPRLNLPAWQWWSEALHGVGQSPGVQFTNPTPAATSFPQVITTAASYNKTLWGTIGSTISTEARAMNNVGHAGLTFWAPNINLIRDPRWGRGHETPGEDPFTTSVYAEHFVRGMQEGEDEKHLKVSSCCKHYYAYDLEYWENTDRFIFDANITKQDETDTYLPAFYSCVSNGKASGMMCSYNAVNGIPSCANGRIMNGIARGEWGFDGYITSDCGAVYEASVGHNYAPPNETCRDVLTAGMDSDCGTFLNDFLNMSLSENVTSIASVNTALSHLYAMQIRLGLFDPVSTQPYMNYSYTDKLDTKEHRELALEAARQGVVLLKNNGKFPLQKDPSMTLAVIGPNANATTTMQANYQGVAPYLISPLEGLSAYARTDYSLGCDTNCVVRSGFPEAVKAASTSDATVLVIGISTLQEAEGMDRTDVALPGSQEELIREVAAASKGPCIVVVMAGGSVDISIARDLEEVDAVLWVGYPGQSGGTAIAETIFGDNNPSGRLPHTQYYKNYTIGLPMTDMSMRPVPHTRNPGRTYRFLTVPSVYRFGDGISYTTFETTATQSPATIPYSTVAQQAAGFNAKGVYGVGPTSTPLGTLVFSTKNTGSVTGQNVVQLFAIPPSSAPAGAPIKSLIGFEKVELAPGQSVDINFSIYAVQLCVSDNSGNWTAVSGTWKFGVGPDMEASVSVSVQ